MPMRHPTASRLRGPCRCAVHARVESLEGRRLLSAGDLDPTFGNGGVGTLAYAGRTDDLAQALPLMGDGRFGVGGSSYGAAFGGTMARSLPDGSPDPSFGPGGSGKVRIDMPW